MNPLDVPSTPPSWLSALGVLTTAVLAACLTLQFLCNLP